MRRHGDAAKENRRPPGTSLHPTHCSSRLRRPLGECRNKSPGQAENAATAVDVTPCLKWLEATVAQSRVIAAAKRPDLAAEVSPPRASSGNRIPPPAQPSCSPDIIRKKSSRELGGCFGIGPVVKGDVKDRRKSKPRALLTVETLPKVAALVPREKQGKGLPRPGRASLEWISDDPDSESTTDRSVTCDESSGSSSLCCGFVHQDLLERWHHLRASKIYTRLDKEELDSDATFSDSWDTVEQYWHEEGDSNNIGLVLEPAKDHCLESSDTSLAEQETVIGTYESCHRRSGFFSSVTQSISETSLGRFSQVMVADALQKMSLASFQEQAKTRLLHNALTEQEDGRA